MLVAYTIRFWRLPPWRACGDTGKSGLDLTRWIRQEHNAEFPVILVTGPVAIRRSPLGKASLSCTLRTNVLTRGRRRQVCERLCAGLSPLRSTTHSQATGDFRLRPKRPPIRGVWSCHRGLRGDQFRFEGDFGRVVFSNWLAGHGDCCQRTPGSNVRLSDTRISRRRVDVVLRHGHFADIATALVLSFGIFCVG